MNRAGGYIYVTAFDAEQFTDANTGIEQNKNAVGRAYIDIRQSLDGEGKNRIFLVENGLNLFCCKKLVLNILLRRGFGDRNELGIVFLDDVIFHCKTERPEEDGLQLVLQGN